MNLAIFEPDIPQNTGAMIRICSCFDVDIDIIHPASFVLSEKSLNRVAMDYIKNVKISEFDDWKDYMTKRNGRKYACGITRRVVHSQVARRTRRSQ